MKKIIGSLAVALLLFSMPASALCAFNFQNASCVTEKVTSLTDNLCSSSGCGSVNATVRKALTAADCSGCGQCADITSCKESLKDLLGNLGINTENINECPYLSDTCGQEDDSASTPDVTEPDAQEQTEEEDTACTDCGNNQNNNAEAETQCSGDDCAENNYNHNYSNKHFLNLSDIYSSLEKYGFNKPSDEDVTEADEQDEQTAEVPDDADTGSEDTNDAGGTSENIDNLSYEEQVVALVNEQRASYGLSELTLNAELSNVARAKSQDMHDNNYFSHTSPTYGSPFDMLVTFGISYRAAGENIAMGYKTPEAVVDGWMNSPGHRANILNSSYTQIGVGYVSDGNYWTQLFIG